MKTEEPRILEGPAGGLEALYRKPGGDGPAVLILHPHPLYGGNMHSKVVFTLARVFGEEGSATLRLNFRGVGASEGEYDDGRGEQDDLKAGLDFLGRELPGARIILAGFSFGAWLALKVGEADDRVSAMLGVGSPAGWGDMDWLLHCRKPKLFIHGSHDEYCDPHRLEQEFRRLEDPKQLEWVEGADHFFTNKLDLLETALRSRMEMLLSA